MHTFEITIQRKSGESWPVVAEQSEAGVFLPVRDEGILQLDPVELRSQGTPKDYGTALGKALFYRQLETGIEAALADASQTMACNMMDESALEGVQAFIEKRPPAWKR